MMHIFPKPFWATKCSHRCNRQGLGFELIDEPRPESHRFDARKRSTPDPAGASSKWLPVIHLVNMRGLTPWHVRARALF
jgi:hypothetical protein